MQRACVQMYIDFKKIKLPCTVKLIRQSPRKLDTDNLPVSMKYIRDAIADHLIPGLAPGRADDDQRLNWQYEQTTAKKSDNPIKYGVWVEFILN